jgi:hypothetical protein
MALPTVLSLYVSVYVLPSTFQMYGFLLTIAVFVTTTVAILGSPSHLSAGEFIEQRLTHALYQPVMLHDSHPERDTVEQPENSGRLNSLATTFPFSKLPFVNTEVAEGDQRAQDIVPVERAFRGEYAIECEDGSFVGAIKVRPANMSTADTGDWSQQVNQLASIITSAVDYDAQQAEIMRSVDYQERLDHYRERTGDLRQRALELQDSTGIEGEEGEQAAQSAMAAQTLADIAEERAAVVNVYNETTLVREHYVIVRVDALDAARTTSSDQGGLAGVPIIGDTLSQRRLQDQLDSDEHTDTMLDLVRQRVNSLASKLSTLEDIQASPLSSVSYAQVLADYYRTANVYANRDFKSLVREAPFPASTAIPSTTSTTARFAARVQPLATGGCAVGQRRRRDRGGQNRAPSERRQHRDRRRGRTRTRADRTAHLGVTDPDPRREGARRAVQVAARSREGRSSARSRLHHP